MMAANGIFFFKNVAAAVFPILNIYASFQHPKLGLPLVKSRSLTFSSSDKVFLLSLPASWCFESDIFVAAIL